MALGFIFPGQGSQSIGMLADLATTYSVVSETFTEASDALGFDLWQLVQNGSAEELNLTHRTQPAMLAAGVAVWRIWRGLDGPTPTMLAGHSLGEYTALVCSGSLDFTVAIALVEERGRLMQTAVPAGQGAMAAILGLEDDAVRALCEAAAQGEVVQAVNYNSPGQVVIAGNRTAVERAVDQAKGVGAKRALILPVSAPSHCDLMISAAKQLAQRLTGIEIGRPEIPIIHNVDVKQHLQSAEISDALSGQLFRPVRWVETVQQMATNGIDLLVECGPGRVLAGLAKRIDKNISSLAVYDEQSLQKALAACREAEGERSGSN